MSRYDEMFDALKAVDVLRRVLAGDEKAWIEGEELIEKIDKRREKAAKEHKEKQAKREKRAKTGRMNSGKFEIAPQVEHGVDHSAKGIVLARKGGVRLVWRSGGSYFSGRGMRSYAPPELEWMYDGKGMPKKITDNFNKRDGERERLTRRLIHKYRPQINEVFGMGAASKIAKLEGTVVL